MYLFFSFVGVGLAVWSVITVFAEWRRSAADVIRLQLSECLLKLEEDLRALEESEFPKTDNSIRKDVEQLVKLSGIRGLREAVAQCPADRVIRTCRPAREKLSALLTATASQLPPWMQLAVYGLIARHLK